MPSQFDSLGKGDDIDIKERRNNKVCCEKRIRDKNSKYSSGGIMEYYPLKIEAVEEES